MVGFSKLIRAWSFEEQDFEHKFDREMEIQPIENHKVIDWLCEFGVGQCI